jgi:hypothetical protein
VHVKKFHRNFNRLQKTDTYHKGTFAGIEDVMNIILHKKEKYSKCWVGWVGRKNNLDRDFRKL